jgi:hypothetical protein
MAKRIVLLSVLLVVAGIFLLGCYTVITHPTVEGEEEEHYSGRYYRENCTDCHVDYHQYPYGFYYGYYPDYYWSYPRWGHYYNYPWWWEWYWWDYWDDDAEYVPRDIEKGERRRSNLAPPYTTGTGMQPSIISNPSPTGPMQIIKKILKSGSGEAEDVNTGGKKEKKEQKKTEEKAPRRR